MAAGEFFVFVGTYTRGKSEGVYVYRMNSSEGVLRSAAPPAPVQDPMFLALDPANRCLYAVTEAYGPAGDPAGTVSAFSIDAATGGLTFLNRQSTRGDGACHLCVDATGRTLLVANYGSGSVAALPIGADGSLGEPSDFFQHEGRSVDAARQEGPHAHSITLDGANRHALVADLGLDQILLYELDAAQGRLQQADVAPVRTAPGAGPRHLDFHPGGQHVYVINELSSTITAYGYDQGSGRLTELQTVSTLREGFSGANHCADIHVSPSGGFVYGSNRGHDSIVTFAINPGDGTLTYVGNEPSRGKTAQNFVIDPSGELLLVANLDSDTVVPFKVDQRTGELDATGHVADVPEPACLKLMPADG